MRARCSSRRTPNFDRYGGRGIRVCERWLECFQNFYADMGDPPEGKTLDRIDVNGNYEPTNCRWITPSEQMLNRRCTKRYLFQGHMLTLKEMSDLTGVKTVTLAYRLYQGWPDEQVGSKPSSRPLEFRAV